MVIAALCGVVSARSALGQWLPNGSIVSDAPGQQCYATGHRGGPGAVTDGSGGAIVFWLHTGASGRATEIRARRITASGAPGEGWPIEGLRLGSIRGRPESSVVGVSDGAGGAIVAWASYPDSASDVWAQRITSSGSIASGWPDTGLLVCSAPLDQNQVAICSDGAGDAIIAWRDYRNDWKSDIYAQRITASGALAEGWPANGVPVCAADSVQEAPQVVADGERGAIFVWHDQRNGPRFTNSDIYGQRINAAGGVAEGWVVNGLQICGAPESQIYPVLISDQTGGAIVAWNDFRSRPGAPDIYAQRITAVGAVALGWESDGAPICTAPKDQSGPLLTEDGEGGALLVWNDYRQGLPVVINDLYAQRISSSGALRWTLDGVPVSAAANAQALAGITSDANGGALIAWQDNRIDPDAWDIYAQHLSASGMPAEGWPADGIPVSLAEGRQENPAIVADGHGGGITTWCDFRNGHDADIYAQHVTQQGIAIPIDPRAVVVQGLRPNPTQGETSITFMIGASEKVWASVYDLSGRRLKTLLTPSVLSAGLHYVTWDARDANGAVVRPGVYLVRIATPTGAETRSLVVLR